MSEKIRIQEFECTRENLIIRGRAYLPEGNHLPAIILSHGFGANATHFEVFCKTFASIGYAAFAFDFCGGCSPEEGRSDGSSLDMTVETEVRDLLTVVDYVSSQEEIDENRITLLGSSQGGFVSAITAARLWEQVRIESLILLCPALCIPDNARAGVLAGTRFDVKNVPETMKCFNMTISKKYFDDVVHMDAYEEISGYKGRVLFIHGMLDSLVDYNYSVTANELFDNPDNHLYLLPGAEHAFTQEEVAIILNTIEEFLP